MKHTVSRRKFLKTSALAALGGWAIPNIIPARVLGLEGATPANSRVNLAIIGLGERAYRVLLPDFAGQETVRLVAGCDPDQIRCRLSKAFVDERYGTTDFATFTDFREVLARRDVDGVVIVTPNHWHVPLSIVALRAGKHVMCEKPETHACAEGRLLAETVRQSGRVYSGGSQRVWNDYNWFHRLVRSGALGEIREVHVNQSLSVPGPRPEPAEPVPAELNWDLWQGPAPAGIYNSKLHLVTEDQTRWPLVPWCQCRDFGGGAMLDWGSHRLGGALFALNRREPPVAIVPHPAPGVTVEYRYADGLRISLQKVEPAGNTYQFYGTLGDTTPEGRKKLPPLPALNILDYPQQGTPSRDFVHCIRQGTTRTFRNVDACLQTLLLCHAGNIAAAVKRPLQWDAQKEEFTGDAEATALLQRPPLREPFSLKTMLKT